MRNIYKGTPWKRTSQNNLIIPQNGVTPIFKLENNRSQNLGIGFKFLPTRSSDLKRAYPIDIGRLRDTCERPSGSFADEMDIGMITPNGSFYWKDNGANILFVAHMDTVLKYNRFYVHETGSGDLAFASTLDNRLGVYLALYYLNKLGVKYDILLTDNEEIIRSSARYFWVGKKYNWAFSFDRPNKDDLDVVLYQYDDWDVRQKLRDVGITVSSGGSYSDIRELEHLGIKCFNFNNGVALPHDVFAHTNLDRLYKTLMKFLGFYERYNNVNMPHISVLAMDAIKETKNWEYKEYKERKKYINIPLLLKRPSIQFTSHEIELENDVEPFVVPYPAVLQAKPISDWIYKEQNENQVKSVKPLYVPFEENNENVSHIFECESCHDMYTEQILYADSVTSVYCPKCREEILEEDSLFDQNEIVRKSDIKEIIIQGKPYLVEKDDLLDGVMNNYEFKKSGRKDYSFFSRSGFILPSEEVGFVGVH